MSKFHCLCAILSLPHAMQWEKNGVFVWRGCKGDEIPLHVVLDISASPNAEPGANSRQVRRQSTEGAEANPLFSAAYSALTNHPAGTSPLNPIQIAG